MHFIDRVSLGKSLAEQLIEYRGKDAVIICIKENSLLTCLSMAMHLRAWVYPLLSERIYTDEAMPVLLGAVDKDAAFHNLPGRTQDADTIATVENKRVATSKVINEKLAEYKMTIDKSIMSGRDVIIAADILTNPLELHMAAQLADGTKTKSVSVAVGNASVEVAEAAQLYGNKLVILDVLTGVLFDDDKYFERPDTYTLEEKRTITQHIATYWR